MTWSELDGVTARRPLAPEALDRALAARLDALVHGLTVA